MVAAEEDEARARATIPIEIAVDAVAGSAAPKGFFDFFRPGNERREGAQAPEVGDENYFAVVPLFADGEDGDSGRLKKKGAIEGGSKGEDEVERGQREALKRREKDVEPSALLKSEGKERLYAGVADPD